MKLAFLISAHKDARHLRALVNSLPADSEFYIHIDQKSDIRRFEEKLDQENIHFIEHRVNVIWGSINEVEYQIELLRAALYYGHADYFISLSGMDYPLWSNADIKKYFRQANGKEILQGISMLHQGKNGQQYRNFRFLTDKPWLSGSLKSKFRVALRKITATAGIHKTLHIHCQAKTYTLYKGSAWWAITPDLARHIIKEWDENEHLVHYFKTSFCPAETFIQTVAFNSEFASRCMLAEGKYQSLAALTPLTYINYDPVVKILTEDDYDTLKASGKMFCRKVVSGKSDKLIEIIDKDR